MLLLSVKKTGLLLYTSIITLQKDLMWWHLKITSLLEPDTDIIQWIYEAFREVHRGLRLQHQHCVNDLNHILFFKNRESEIFALFQHVAKIRA